MPLTGNTWFPSGGKRPSQTWGCQRLRGRKPGAGMGWRVTIELGGADGTKQTHEVARGGGSAPHSVLDPLGLSLEDGKILPAGVQRHLVQARGAECVSAFNFDPFRRPILTRHGERNSP